MTLTREQITEEYKNGRRNFRGADLSGAYIRFANLEGANFHKADLSDADVRDTSLEESLK